MRFLLTCCLLALSLNTHAQDQMLLRFNHSGIMALMKATLQYNQRGQNSAGFKIPQGLYSFKIRKADLAKNPIIQLVSEVSDVNLMRDFPYYIYNSNINVVGEIDQSSVRSTVTNYSTKGFNLSITFNIPQLRMSIPEISLCEKKSGSRCGAGLKASFKNSSISLARGSVIRMTTNFYVAMNEGQAKMRLVRATSNLGTSRGPRINISPGSLSIPPVTITVNGQSAQLDTSSLRGELLKNTGFLANKLLGFAGDFIAEDLAALVNKTLQNECVPTRLNVVTMEPRPVAGRPLVVGMQANANFGTLFQRDVARIIKSARFDLVLKSLRTPESKNVELRANGSLRINGKRWQVGNRLGNSSRALPALNVDQILPAQNHFGVAISEPVVNSALELLNGTGLFQELIEKHVDSKGLYVQSAKIHFQSNPDRFYVIVGTQVNLNEVNSDGVLSWIKNWFAAWLERNNNGSKLYFPMQFEVIPRLVQAGDGSVQLRLRVNSPFVRGYMLRNDFKYPSNITAATNSVREGVVKELQEGLMKYVNQEFTFDLSSYLNQKGMSFNLKNMKLVNSAYLLLGMDIKSLNLAALNSRGGSCR